MTAAQGGNKSQRGSGRPGCRGLTARPACYIPLAEDRTALTVRMRTFVAQASAL